ncbi:hypothetical protein RYX36_004497 [Vicia faba]
MRSSNIFVILSLFLLLVSIENIMRVYGEDPTYGFTSVPLTEANFVVQKPWNIPVEQRYSFIDGVHRFWVYAHDKPYSPGYGYVPKGTSGATIAQIHGSGDGGATTLILRIYNGDMRYYDTDLVAENLYDKWFRVNIIHDVDGGIVSVFIDGENKFQTKDHGPGDLYFKCGVYVALAHISNYMESRWRHIKIYKK